MLPGQMLEKGLETMRMEERVEVSFIDRLGTKKEDYQIQRIRCIFQNNSDKNERNKVISGSEVREKQWKNEKMEFSLVRIKQSQEETSLN